MYAQKPNTMRPTILLPLASAVILSACGQQSTGHADDMAHRTDDRYDALAERVGNITGMDLPDHSSMVRPVDHHNAEWIAAARREQAQPAAQGGIRTHIIPSIDLHVPMAQMDLPAHWQFKHDPRTGKWTATAKDLKVDHMGGTVFNYVTGPMAQFYQASGAQLRKPMSAEQVLRQELETAMRKEGYELLGVAPAPGIAQADLRYMQGLWTIEPTRKTTDAIVIDWRKGSERLAMVIQQFVFGGSESTTWGYSVTGLETTNALYDREKAALMSAFSGVRYNPAYFQAYARSEQQKAQQSQMAHSQRMQANQAAFDAQQRTHRETSDAINSAITDSYNTRMESQDRGMAAWSDMMYEQQNAVNPYSGEQMKVESGGQRYWMNQYGEYYGTNDILTDPNAGNTSNYQWREVEVEP
jgi:hypothetical protein